MILLASVSSGILAIWPNREQFLVSCSKLYHYYLVYRCSTPINISYLVHIGR